MKNVSVDQLLAMWNTRENMAIAKIESYYLHHKRSTVHVALETIEDTEWFWSPNEIKRFDELWKQGMPLTQMAKELGRSEIAVLLESLDRLYEGKIKARKWKIW
jgi:hypothetical protein